MTGPLVSILIPAYNAQFFEPCLASCMKQTYGNTEIIVGDDSPGNTISNVVARSRSTRVRYHRNPRRLGFHGNFTRLFSIASGQYIKFVNDDDMLHPNCVATMLAAMES